MKKCPECNAEIQENARFCLYCMTSFEEKQTIENPKENSKRWLYIIASALGVALIALCVFVFWQKDNTTYESSDTSVDGCISSETDAIFGGDSGASSEEPISSESESDEVSDYSNNENNAQDTSKNESDTPGKSDEGIKTNNTFSNNTQTQAPSNNNNDTPDRSDSSTTTNNTSASTTSQNNTSSDTTTSGDSTSNKKETVEPSPTQAKYCYAEATKENTYPDGYNALNAPQNAIVITKVNYIEESGNYVIPDTIDEKKVVAIMPLAFCDAAISHTVKSVTLPATVKTIRSNAFKDCYNLKDIYIKSGVIAIYKDAFPEAEERTDILTIHCARDCRNFDFYYYRNIAVDYNAEYREWNG